MGRRGRAVRVLQRPPDDRPAGPGPGRRPAAGHRSDYLAAAVTLERAAHAEAVLLTADIIEADGTVFPHVPLWQNRLRYDAPPTPEGWQIRTAGDPWAWFGAHSETRRLKVWGADPGGSPLWPAWVAAHRGRDDAATEPGAAAGPWFEEYRSRLRTRAAGRWPYDLLAALPDALARRFYRLPNVEWLDDPAAFLAAAAGLR